MLILGLGCRPEREGVDGGGQWPADDDDPGSPMGAVWLRYLPDDDPGYGFIDADTPEMTMGLYRPWRGRGIGRALLRRLLADAAGRGITRISLSVEPGNRAQRLYESEGFVVVGTDDGGSFTMLPDGHRRHRLLASDLDGERRRRTDVAVPIATRSQMPNPSLASRAVRAPAAGSPRRSTPPRRLILSSGPVRTQSAGIGWFECG